MLLLLLGKLFVLLKVALFSILLDEELCEEAEAVRRQVLHL